jgi:hypothetical protein
LGARLQAVLQHGEATTYRIDLETESHSGLAREQDGSNQASLNQPARASLVSILQGTQVVPK